MVHHLVLCLKYVYSKQGWLAHASILNQVLPPNEPSCFPPWCSTELQWACPLSLLFTELQALYEFKHSAHPLAQWRSSVLTPHVYSILLALGRKALNGCGLVIWGLICKANANYLKLGLRGVEHSLKIAFVLFENHSLAWQDRYHQSGERIQELDSLFIVENLFHSSEWQGLVGRDNRGRSLASHCWEQDWEGKGWPRKLAALGDGVSNGTSPSRDALGSNSS